MIDNNKVCFMCNNTNVEKHHIYKGHKCRQIADKEGMWVWLCRKHHEQMHKNRELDLELMKLGQEKYEQTHTRADFIEKFNKSYL